MQLVADTHSHLYPCYDLGRAFAAATANLHHLAPQALPLLCLTERHDCTFFADLQAGRRAAPGWTVHPTAEPETLRLAGPGGATLHLCAGRQVVTAERLEVLALLTTTAFPDGRPLAETLAALAAAGATAVLPWAAGKWWGARGKRVRGLLNTPPSGEVLLSDSAMRPRGWGPSPLLRAAAAAGAPVLAGTDPLPLAGEEQRLGRYASLMACPAGDPAGPAAALRQALQQPAVSPAHTVGRRLSPWAFLRLQVRLRQAR